MSETKYTLYYYPLNASMAPHMVLEELGVDYDLVLVDRKTNAHKDAEYLALNPMGRIPALVIDGEAMFESPAICMYLAEQYSNKALMPAIGSDLRPQFLQWMMFLTNTLQAELMVFIYPERHGGQGVSCEQIADAQNARVNGILTILDQHLANQKFLVGNELSICDYFLFMLCIWADELAKPPLQFENLSRYLRALAATRTVQAVCAKEGISLTAYV